MQAVEFVVEDIRDGRIRRLDVDRALQRLDRQRLDRQRLGRQRLGR